MYCCIMRFISCFCSLKFNVYCLCIVKTYCMFNKNNYSSSEMHNGAEKNKYLKILSIYDSHKYLYTVKDI